MSIERIQTVVIHGSCVKWDGINADEVEAIAGKRWVGVSGDTCIITTRRGDPLPIRIGTYLIRWDDGDIIGWCDKEWYEFGITNSG